MGNFSYKVRQFIYDRDNNQCLKCGCSDNLTLDHILPISKGGGNEYTNLQTLCSKCNQDKGTAEIDYREWLEYPYLFEEEGKFDWSLSMYEIDSKYAIKKKPKKTSQFITNSNVLWDGKMPDTHKEEMLKCESGFVIHNGKKCLEYGKLNCKIGYGAEKGQRVFYDNIDEKLILDYAGTIISYHYNTIAHLVTKNSYAPREYTKILPKVKRTKIKVPKIYEFSETTTVKDIVIIEKQKFNIESYNNEPEPNFHY